MRGRGAFCKKLPFPHAPHSRKNFMSRWEGLKSLEPASKLQSLQTQHTAHGVSRGIME